MHSAKQLVQVAVASIHHGVIETNVRNKELTHQDVKQLTDVLKNNSSVIKLDVSSNPAVGDTGCSYISSMLQQNRTLTEINLADIGMTAAGCQILCIRLTSDKGQVKKIDLKGNSFGSLGPVPLYRTLKAGSSLTDITLSGLDREGIAQLGASVRLGHSRVNWLRLPGCQVDSYFVQDIVAIVTSRPSLVGLEIGDGLSVDLLVQLTRPLCRPECGLKALVLHETALSSHACKVLLDMLLSNRSLKLLEFVNCEENLLAQPGFVPASIESQGNLLGALGAGDFFATSLRHGGHFVIQSIKGLQSSKLLDELLRQNRPGAFGTSERTVAQWALQSPNQPTHAWGQGKEKKTLASPSSPSSSSSDFNNYNAVTPASVASSAGPSTPLSWRSAALSVSPNASPSSWASANDDRMWSISSSPTALWPALPSSTAESPLSSSAESRAASSSYGSAPESANYAWQTAEMSEPSPSWSPFRTLSPTANVWTSSQAFVPEYQHQQQQQQQLHPVQQQSFYYRYAGQQPEQPTATTATTTWKNAVTKHRPTISPTATTLRGHRALKHAQAAVTRFVNVPGKQKETAFIASNPFKPELAIATQCPSRYNQVIMHGIDSGRQAPKAGPIVRSVARLGRKVGAIAFDSFNGNLVVATASGQSQLLCYEYQDVENSWVLVWKYLLHGYGSHVSNISVSNFCVFLKLDDQPVAGVKLPSKFLLFQLSTGNLHSIACDGKLFPKCQDLLVYPDQSALLVFRSTYDTSKIHLLHTEKFVSEQSGDHPSNTGFVVPNLAVMSVATMHLPHNCHSLVVNTYNKKVLWLTWEKSADVLRNFRVYFFTPTRVSIDQHTQSVYFRAVQYMTNHSSEINVLEEDRVAFLKNMPECAEVLGASLGYDDVLSILVSERVKLPGKKWPAFRRTVYTVSCKQGYNIYGR